MASRIQLACTRLRIRYGFDVEPGESTAISRTWVRIHTRIGSLMSWKRSMELTWVIVVQISDVMEIERNFK